MNTSYSLHACTNKRKMAEAIQLRYLAYRNAGAINENPEAAFRDQYDLLPNTSSCIVYEGHAPVASIRACVYSKELDFLQLPAFEAYGRRSKKNWTSIR